VRDFGGLERSIFSSTSSEKYIRTTKGSSMGIAASFSAEEVSSEVSKLLVNDPERDRVVSKVIEQGIDGVEALDLTNEDFEGIVPFISRS
jgi:hypothetical protein